MSEFYYALPKPRLTLSCYINITPQGEVLRSFEQGFSVPDVVRLTRDSVGNYNVDVNTTDMALATRLAQSIVSELLPTHEYGITILYVPDHEDVQRDFLLANYATVKQTLKASGIRLAEPRIEVIPRNGYSNIAWRAKAL